MVLSYNSESGEPMIHKSESGKQPTETGNISFFTLPAWLRGICMMDVISFFIFPAWTRGLCMIHKSESGKQPSEAGTISFFIRIRLFFKALINHAWKVHSTDAAFFKVGR